MSLKTRRRFPFKIEAWCTDCGESRIFGPHDEDEARDWALNHVCTEFTPTESTMQVPEIRSWQERELAVMKRAELRKGDRRLVRLEQSANRVRNLTPGRCRIQRLAAIAEEYRIEAAIRRLPFADPLGIGINPELSISDAYADRSPEAIAALDKAALFLERLAWDLAELRDTVRPSARRSRSRYDSEQWKGPRP